MSYCLVCALFFGLSQSLLASSVEYVLADPGGRPIQNQLTYKTAAVKLSDLEFTNLYKRTGKPEADYAAIFKEIGVSAHPIPRTIWELAFTAAIFSQGNREKINEQLAMRLTNSPFIGDCHIIEEVPNCESLEKLLRLLHEHNNLESVIAIKKIVDDFLIEEFFTKNKWPLPSRETIGGSNAKGMFTEIQTNLIGMFVEPWWKYYKDYSNEVAEFTLVRDIFTSSEGIRSAFEILKGAANSQASLFTRVLDLEIKTFLENKVFFLRATKPFKANQTLELLDQPLRIGGYQAYNSISFAQSLLSGVATDMGASILGYSTNDRCIYALVMTKEEFKCELYEGLLWVPPLSAVKDLLRRGEYTHPRVRVIPEEGGRVSLQGKTIVDTCNFFTLTCTSEQLNRRYLEFQHEHMVLLKPDHGHQLAQRETELRNDIFLALKTP